MFKQILFIFLNMDDEFNKNFFVRNRNRKYIKKKIANERRRQTKRQIISDGKKFFFLSNQFKRK